MFPYQRAIDSLLPTAPLLRSTLQAEDYLSLGNEGEEELARSDVV